MRLPVTRVVYALIIGVVSRCLCLGMCSVGRVFCVSPLSEYHIRRVVLSTARYQPRVGFVYARFPQGHVYVSYPSRVGLL